jgi:hypothetical protein
MTYDVEYHFIYSANHFIVKDTKNDIPNMFHLSVSALEASLRNKNTGGDPKWQIAERNRNPELHNFRKILQSHGS